MYEIYCKLRDKKGYKDSDVARITGITKSTFSDWKSGRSCPKNDKLQKIAEMLGVTVDYLMTGKEIEKERENTLSSKEELDIAKKLDKILFDIDKTDENPLYYNGEKIDDKSLKVLEEALKSAMRTVELVKEKNKSDKNKQS
jgi:transcriptional regulator with XRE-family HTH domain